MVAVTAHMSSTEAAKLTKECKVPSGDKESSKIKSCTHAHGQRIREEEGKDDEARRHCNDDTRLGQDDVALHKMRSQL